MTPREHNYGASIYGECELAQPLLDILGQGDGRKVCAQWYARLSRTLNDASADMLIWPLMHCVGLVQVVRRSDGRLTDEKAADLAAFIVERGLGLIERDASPFRRWALS